MGATGTDGGIAGDAPVIDGLLAQFLDNGVLGYAPLIEKLLSPGHDKGVYGQGVIPINHLGNMLPNNGDAHSRAPIEDVLYSIPRCHRFLFHIIYQNPFQGAP